MAKCVIFWDVKLQAYQLQMKGDFGKIESIITFLKKNIPHSDRNWDPSTKTWTFTEQYLNGVQKICTVIFGAQEVACLTKDKVEGSSKVNSVQSSNTLDSVMISFMKLLPFEAAQAAYRRASLVLHPDKGGDMESMTRLNQAWSRLEKELYRQ